MLLVSYSRRPISVLLPSSTLPAVMKRRTPRSSAGSFGWRVSSEISFFLAPLHRRVGGLVVHARRAALGDLLDGRLADDRFDAWQRRLATGQVQLMSPTVRKRTVSVLDGLAVARRRDRRHRHQQAARRTTSRWCAK